MEKIVEKEPEKTLGGVSNKLRRVVTQNHGGKNKRKNFFFFLRESSCDFVDS